jgi:hypothetical protein
MLCDYSHGGLRQLSRWLSAETIEPRYEEGQMVEMLRLSDQVCLMAAIARAALMGFPTGPFASRLDELFDAVVASK